MNKMNNQKGESMIKGNNNEKEINETKQKWNTRNNIQAHQSQSGGRREDWQTSGTPKIHAAGRRKGNGI